MGLSFTHLILILAIILIFFGPSRLPGLGKSFGEAIRGFKKGLNDDEIDVTESLEQRKRENLNSGSQSSTSQQKSKDRNEA